MKYLIAGILTAESPMRKVFPDGEVPLARTGSIRVRLGDATELEECYFLALRTCTQEQLWMMADMMVAAGQGTLAEANAYLKGEHTLPVRASNFAVAAISLRAFI